MLNWFYMSERVKTILLILFIAGVIGAFNAIIGLSQSTGTNPWQTIGQALGLIKKPTPEPGRKFDFIAGELSKNQATTTTPAATPASKPTASAPTPMPTATPKTQPIQTSPELPPLPPLGGSSLGVVTANYQELPPLPPIGGNTLGVSTVAKQKIPPLPPVKVLGTKTASLESDMQGFLNSASRFFGF